MNLPLFLREWIDIRGRGGFKTWDFVKYFLFFASKGFRAKIFSAGRDQLNQPKKYLDHLINNSFLKYLIKDKLKEAVYFTNGGELELKNLTELNARSGRGDLVGYDEFAQANPDAYRAAVNILAGSELGITGYISTPVQGSIEHEVYDRLKLREVKYGEIFVYERRWYEIKHLYKKKEWYDEQKRILPGWYFRQEHECSHELPMGAVFQNVEYGKYPDWLMDAIEDEPVRSGLDWNPVAGHVIVGIKWTKDFKHCVVMEEANIGQGYSTEMTMEQWNIIKLKASFGNHLNYECSGINEFYVKWLNEMKSDFAFPDQNWHSEEWDSAGINKLKIATFIIQNAVCIWVDKVRLPDTAKNIEDCQWDSEADTPKLKKDKAASPHYLDAFLHAASEENRRDTKITFGDWR